MLLFFDKAAINPLNKDVNILLYIQNFAILCFGNKFIKQHEGEFIPDKSSD